MFNSYRRPGADRRPRRRIIAVGLFTLMLILALQLAAAASSDPLAATSVAALPAGTSNEPQPALGLDGAPRGLRARANRANSPDTAATQGASPAPADLAASLPADSLLAGPLADPEGRFDSVRDLVQGAVDRGVIPGCSLLLIHEGRVVFAEAFGFADLGQQTPFALDTVVRVASSSKYTIGMAIMMLVDDGLIGLDDEVGDYIPEFKDLRVKGSLRPASPSVRQLLSLTSGMEGNSPSLNRRNITLEECVRIIAEENNPLRAEPGTDVYYGGAAMQVAGRLVEVVSGQEYSAFLEQRLFEPLGMRDTAFNLTAAQKARCANVYSRRSPGSFVKVFGPPLTDTRNPRVAGGLFSTLEDYGRLLLMYRNGGEFNGERMLSEASVLEMRRTQTAGLPITYSPYENYPGFEDTQYGLGMWLNLVDPQTGEGALVSSQGGFGTTPWFDVERDIIGVFLVQTPLSQIFELTVKVVETSTEAILAGK